MNWNIPTASPWLTPPRPRGFMPFWAPEPIAAPIHDVQCFVDPHAPDYMLVVMEMRNILGSAATWAGLGALNLAAAYRPEGVP
jgi:hypothetical protein